MAKVAKRIEELEGNFMIKEVDGEEIKTSTSRKRMDTMKVGKENENVNLRGMEETLYAVRDGTRRDQSAKQTGCQAYYDSVRLEPQASLYFAHVQCGLPISRIHEI